MRKPLLESQVQSQIIKYLNKLPECKVTRIILSNEGGVSDLLVCYKGKFIALEIKRSEQKADPLQVDYINEIIEAGGSGAVVWTKLQARQVLRHPEKYQTPLSPNLDKVEL